MCKPCRTNFLENKFPNWTHSGIEIIDLFILINSIDNRLVEWIPYDLFDNVKDMGKSNSTTLYSAIWKNGQLYYDDDKEEWMRGSANKKVSLKCKSYDDVNEFLDEV